MPGIKCEACRAFYLFFRNEFNKVDNTGARMLDSIYHMTLNHLKLHFGVKNLMIFPYFMQRYNFL